MKPDQRPLQRESSLRKHRTDMTAEEKYKEFQVQESDVSAPETDRDFYDEYVQLRRNILI
jgi:hypothetical protein